VIYLINGLAEMVVTLVTLHAIKNVCLKKKEEKTKIKNRKKIDFLNFLIFFSHK